MEIETPDTISPPRLQYDSEWLAITRAFHPYLSLERRQVLPPREEAERLLVEAREWVNENIVGKEVSIEKTDNEAVDNPHRLSLLDVEATQYFCRTAPTEEEGGGGPGERALASCASHPR